MKQRIALLVCIALHVYVVWNVYEADQLTPRIVEVKECYRGAVYAQL